MKVNLQLCLLKTVIFLSIVSPFCNKLKAQELEVYSFDFPFQEGVYLNFQEFKNNSPSYSKIERRGSNLLVFNDSTEKMIKVDPHSIWGYSQADNVYISYEGAYWRIINIGQLSQFTAIIVRTVRTIDSFGFPLESTSRSLEQAFFNFEDGAIYKLNSKNLNPFIENEPQLNNRIRGNRRIREAELILLLKSYNELHPIYFPIYE